MINHYDSVSGKVIKSVRYQLFIDEEDFDALTIKAQQEGYLNLGSYLRDLIKQELRKERGEKRHGN